MAGYFGGLVLRAVVNDDDFSIRLRSMKARKQRFKISPLIFGRDYNGYERPRVFRCHSGIPWFSNKRRSRWF